MWDQVGKFVLESVVGSWLGGLLGRRRRPDPNRFVTMPRTDPRIPLRNYLLQESKLSAERLKRIAEAAAATIGDGSSIKRTAAMREIYPKLVDALIEQQAGTVGKLAEAELRLKQLGAEERLGWARLAQEWKLAEQQREANQQAQWLQLLGIFLNWNRNRG